MATPTIESVASSTDDSDVTTHTVTMPSGVVSGNLLVCFFAYDGGVETLTMTGWTELFNDTETDVSLACLYKTSDGGEGATENVGTVGAERSCHRTYRISGHSTSQAPEAGTSATGLGTSIDPPSVTPTGGSKTYLFITVFGSDGQNTVSAYPTSYTNTGTQNNATAAGCTQAWATRALEAASDDPAAFTQSGTQDFVTNTIAIHPAGGGTYLQGGVFQGNIASPIALG